MEKTIEQKVRETTFEMFSEKGDKVVKSLVLKTMKKIGGKERVTREGVLFMIQEGMKIISNGGHGEVYDTEPEEHIVMFVNRKLKEVGYSFRIEYDDL